VKIASQRLHFSPLPNLRALCGESLRSFRIKTLQIAPPPTSLFSQSSALPGAQPLRGLCAPISVPSVLRFFLQLLCCQQVAASCPSLCPLFRTRVLCFQSFPASFSKTPGVGGIPVQPNCGRPPSSQSGTAISGCPPLPSPCQLQCPNACGSKARRAAEEFSPARQCWVANQHTNFPSPSGAAKNSSSGTAISACPLQGGCPPTISQQSSTTTKWRTDDFKTCSPTQTIFGVPSPRSPNL